MKNHFLMLVGLQVILSKKKIVSHQHLSIIYLKIFLASKMNEAATISLI